MQLPNKLSRLAKYDTGTAWLESLPQLLMDLSEQWEIELGEPYEGASVSYVAPAFRLQKKMVLKIQWPHEECEYEADALKLWDGDGAVKLFDHDRHKHALLLEHCSPGTQLAASECQDKLAVIINLLPRLWEPAKLPFKTLAAEAEGWRSNIYKKWELAGQPCEHELIDAAATFLRELPISQGEQVLVHQDLHAENILATERDTWLAIDPKPLIGEREFSIAPIIRSFELGHSRNNVIDRLDRLCSELKLDRERARCWTIAQTIAWSLGSDFAKHHYETARWLMDVC